jgi:Response regulator containing CheY-like receiver, AAA-type ATPase, and DNA-binding domains
VANIMVVDDAAFMRLMIRNILEEAGHTVVCEAENGQEAVEKYKQYHPDLVTLDITMPVMEGLETLQRIRRYDPFAVVIMCSAMGQKPMVIEAIKMGAKDFIVKPVQQERVVEAVSKALGLEHYQM